MIELEFLIAYKDLRNFENNIGPQLLMSLYLKFGRFHLILYVQIHLIWGIKQI